jgi:DNA primase
MSQYYTAAFLRTLRNAIPIDVVIVDLLDLDQKRDCRILRFRCPLCGNFHTATNHKTNLARCFDCEKNFNPIDMVMTVGKCSFIEAVEKLKDKINL